MIKVKISAILFVGLILALPYTAQAYPVSTVDIVNTGYGANEIISVWGGGQEGLNVHAGVYTLDKTYGAGEGKLWSNGPIGGFCTELSELAPDSTLSYNVIELEGGPVPTSFLGGAMGSEKADYIRELWGRFYDPSWTYNGPFYWKQNREAGAFAAAIWEIVYEDLPASPLKWNTKIDSTPGDLGFRCDYDATNIANSWLHALDGTGPKADLRVFSYKGSQDYIVQVPEPTTIALLGLGSVLSMVRRKRNAA